jgi:hypothetical protein
MNINPSCSYCWILDDVEAHFSAIWELASVFQQRLPELRAIEIQQQLQHGLLALQQSGYVEFYEGEHFTGDESIVIPAITADFIAVQAEDWKNPDHSTKQLKLYITESGRAFFLEHCTASFFEGIG